MSRRFILFFSIERVGCPGPGAIRCGVDSGPRTRHVCAKPLPLWCRRHGGGRPARRRADTDHCTRKYQLNRNINSY